MMCMLNWGRIWIVANGFFDCGRSYIINFQFDGTEGNIDETSGF